MIQVYALNPPDIYTGISQKMLAEHSLSNNRFLLKPKDGRLCFAYPKCSTAAIMYFDPNWVIPVCALESALLS